MENVNTADEVISFAPYFCQNANFRKILWEELHDPVRKENRGMKFKRSKKKSTVIKHYDLASDEEVLNSDLMEDLCVTSMKSDPEQSLTRINS